MRDEPIKIKKLIGIIFRGNQIFLQVLWKDKALTWETPDNVFSPILFENFINKLEDKITYEYDQKLQIKKKIEEKHFISSLKPQLKKNKKIIFNQDNLSAINQKNLSPVKIIKNNNVTSKSKSTKFAHKKEFAGLGKSSNLNMHAYKTDFLKTNQHFLANKRYFEDIKTPKKIEKVPVILDKKDGNLIMYKEKKEIASLELNDLESQDILQQKMRFEMSCFIQIRELESFLFSVRQNSNVHAYNVFGVKFLYTTTQFREMCNKLDEWAYVDTTNFTYTMFFCASKILQRFEIFNTHCVIKFSAQAINTITNLKLLRSFDNSINVWHSGEISHSKFIIGYILFNCPDFEEKSIHKFAIFSPFHSYLCHELVKYLTMKGKEIVSFDNSEIDSVFVHDANIQMINNMPYFIYLIESKCNFYFIQSKIKTSKTNFLSPIFIKNKGVLFILENFIECKLSDLIEFVNYICLNQENWIVYCTRATISKVEELMVKDTEYCFLTNFLALCIESDELTDIGVIQFLKNVRYDFYKSKRFFYAINLNKNSSLFRTPDKFLNIIRKSNF